MAIITHQLLRNLFTGFKTSFQDGFQSAAPQYTKIATDITSGSESETYGWLGQWPGLREWVGPRVIQSMQASAYQIVNKPYEATVGVDKFKIEDDKIGIYTPMMREYGRAVGVFPDEIIFGLLRNGFSSTCYDGQYFFDADHPVNSQADGQGAVTSVSNVLIDNDYTGDAWYLLDTNRAIKPLIYQVRSQPNFIALTREDDEAVFMTHEYRYGVDLRANGGYGPWQMAFGAKATLNASNLWAAYSAMSAVKADGGRPLGIYPNLLVVPTSLEREAVQLLNRDLFNDGGEVVSNELKGKFDLLVSRYL